MQCALRRRIGVRLHRLRFKPACKSRLPEHFTSTGKQVAENGIGNKHAAAGEPQITLTDAYEAVFVQGLYKALVVAHKVAPSHFAVGRNAQPPCRAQAQHQQLKHPRFGRKFFHILPNLALTRARIPSSLT